MHSHMKLEEVEDLGQFDAVVCTSATVLLSDPGATVKLRAKHVKPGGRIVVEVPTESSHIIDFV